jgi:hypothetical protein
MARSEWGNFSSDGTGNAPFCRKLFHRRGRSRLWNGERQDKRLIFKLLQLYSPSRTVPGLRVLGSGVGAFRDLVILGSDGKLDAELASREPTTYPSIDFLHC